jgi:ribosomal protein S4E
MIQINNSKENYRLLDAVKQYLQVEHEVDEEDLLDYLRKQASLQDSK